MSQEELKTVLLVDDEPVNIAVLSGVLRDTYRVIVAKTGRQALDRIDRGAAPDIILLDIMMPEMDGFNACKLLKEREDTRTIPIVFVSSMSEHHDEEKGLALGAVDYITKPFSPAIVLTRISNILQLKEVQQRLETQNTMLEETVQERTLEVFQTQNVTIHALASLAETRDNETGNHIRRTQHYVKTLALDLQHRQLHLDELTEANIDLLFRSAPLHDIGKVGIPDHILLKPGKLTPEEFDIMKTHTSLGSDALIQAQASVGDMDTSFLSYAREISASHHEKWDGSGYPYALSGEDIPLSGRIMAVADVYDALISKRIYKPAFTHEKAKSILLEGSGSHFDPNIIQSFLNTEAEFIAIARRYQD